MKKEKIPFPIVIFGASSGAVKVAKILIGLQIEIAFLVDNNVNKWGSIVCGKEVKSPLVLLEKKYSILIGSNFQAEIEDQLTEMGLIDNLIIKDQVIMDYMESHISDFNYLKTMPIQNETKYLFDLTEGITVFSGIESWTFSIVREMRNHDKPVQILYSEEENEEFPKDLNEVVWKEPHDYDHYLEYIQKLVFKIANNLPCVLYDNWQNHSLIAAAIIKHFHPDKMKCVSVLHNDKKIIYRKTAYMYPYIDAIAGISRDILKKLKEEYEVPDEKFYYQESPVAYENEFTKDYTLDAAKPLQIGYAARIVKLQKRSDLLIPLIEELEKKNIYYEFQIAGNGDFYNELFQWVKAKGLENKIILLGFIERKKMPDFWKKIDVFVNVSDYEGTCLSMLEAMSYGAVPVLTGVSGVNDFIENEENGYITPLGQVTEMANAIDMLALHRELLRKMGNKNRNIIAEKCNMGRYIKYIEKFAEI